VEKTEMAPSKIKCFFIALLTALAGCAQTAPFRPLTKAQTGCVPNEQTGKLSADAVIQCASHSFEHASVQGQTPYDYSLYFVEVDDQGWERAPSSLTQTQGDFLLDAIRDRVRPKAEPRSHEQQLISTKLHRFHLVVFVHGWKHNANVQDGNVESFRRVLREIAIAERNGGGTDREVIGIYIGWRGDSINWPEPIKSLSFWDRKNTAAEVAQGSLREIFARLDALSDEANKPWQEFQQKLIGSPPTLLQKYSGGAETVKEPEKVVRALFIGHSFGGHILLTALGGSVLRDLAGYDERYRGFTQKSDCYKKNIAGLQRDADMVVLINPAVEGTRYEPLHQIRNKWSEACYRSPLFVSITSREDTATKLAFPLGRRLSTVFEEYSGNDAEKQADTKTFGHDERYITHDLRLLRSALHAAAPDPEQIPSICSGWERDSLIERIGKEFRNGRKFLDDAKSKYWRPNEKRFFCAGTVLEPRSNIHASYAPILNIQADGDLIPDHNNIYGTQFISFLRELYMDSLDRSVTLQLR
jgi:hypothetical protein